MHWLPVQGGSADFSGPQHVDAVLPPSPTPGQRGRPQSATTISHSGAVPTVHQENNCKARFPLHSTSHLSPAELWWNPALEYKVFLMLIIDV